MPHAALRLSDRELLAECDVHTYRASGPGGQKRNKIESAVRIRHRPTGVTAIAEESRSQLENRPRALRRVREAIALQVRSPVELGQFQLPSELVAALRSSGRLQMNNRNPDYPFVIATLLDLLSGCAGRVSDAAERLGISTHHLTQFLGEHPRAWQQVNQIRQQHGLKPLKM
ncbi:MAG: peptide chain release factor-like protein [Planctomycetes bacterium]|nr:peptide chain release factor-like protein [Planctomycetota bacterium]